MQNQPHLEQIAIRAKSTQDYSKELKEEFDALCEEIKLFTEKAKALSSRFDIKASIDRYGNSFSAELYFPVTQIKNEFKSEIDIF